MTARADARADQPGHLGGAAPAGGPARSQASDDGPKPHRLRRDDGGAPWYDGLEREYEEFITWPDDGYQYEMDDGILRVRRYAAPDDDSEEALGVSPAPLDRHQQVVLELAMLLTSFIKTRRLGMVWVAPRDVRLAPGTVRQPDLVVVVRERMAISRRQCVDGAPDLVIEVLSPGTRELDRDTKFLEYERHGVREYWVIDPDALHASESFARVGARFEKMSSAGGRIASRVLDGFVLDLAELARSLDPFAADDMEAAPAAPVEPA